MSTGSETGETGYILLVEDEAAHRELITRALADGLHAVRSARTLSECHERLAGDGLPRMAIVDYRLPDGSGSEIVTLAAGRFPVIIMTSFGSEQAAVDVIKAGALDYVVKSPETFADMGHIVERVLREWQHVLQHRRSEEELVRRDEVLHGVARALSVLLGSSRFFDAIDKALRLLGEATGIDRVSVFQNSYDGGGLRLLTLRHEWVRTPEWAVLPTRRMDGVSYASLSTANEEILARGEILQSHVRDLSLAERELFDGAGIKSILSVPIISADEFWGFIGFDSIENDREWSPAEVAVLRIAATAIGAGIEKARKEEFQRALERQMQQAQKLESLGVLAGGIAHDFNNLLMAILGHADLALQDLAPLSPARDSLVEIERASRRAADLCKQMLAYSGRGRFIIENINLRELIHEMVHLLKTSISKKAVLNLDLEHDIPSINGDATQIRQVVMNLITNASDALADNLGVISLRTAVSLRETETRLPFSLGEYLPPGLYVELCVCDTGCGMDKETLAKIFDPFFTTKFTGRGLGLAAVLGIVRGHHGGLDVQSEIGKGTSFSILFPAFDAATPGEAVEKKKPEAAAPGSPATVLIVDDEETVRVLTGKMLERSGYSVLMAANGSEALAVYREKMPAINCVLLDLTMPDMDGEETFNELKKIDPRVRVLMTSGYTSLEVEERFVGSTLAGFIEKPYRMETLLAALARVLSVPVREALE